MIIDKGKFQAEQFSQWKEDMMAELKKLEKRVEQLEKSAKKQAKEKAE